MVKLPTAVIVQAVLPETTVNRTVSFFLYRYTHKFATCRGKRISIYGSILLSFLGGTPVKRYLSILCDLKSEKFHWL